MRARGHLIRRPAGSQTPLAVERDPQDTRSARASHRSSAITKSDPNGGKRDRERRVPSEMPDPAPARRAPHSTGSQPDSAPDPVGRRDPQRERLAPRVREERQQPPLDPARDPADGASVDLERRPQPKLANRIVEVSVARRGRAVRPARPDAITQATRTPSGSSASEGEDSGRRPTTVAPASSSSSILVERRHRHAPARPAEIEAGGSPRRPTGCVRPPHAGSRRAHPRRRSRSRTLPAPPYRGRRRTGR